MVEDNAKHHWFRVVTVALVTFIMAFLAFYIVMEILYERIEDNAFGIRKFEKMIQNEQRDFRNFEEKMMENPFIPKTRPMIVNLVKENNEYKVIVDLTPFSGDEKGINVTAENKVLTVTGELDKKFFGNEKIINFTQSYYLDDYLMIDKVTKEKKGNKYIFTIPYED